MNTAKRSVSKLSYALVVAIITIICAISLSATSAFASENVTGKYKDVSSNEWYTEYIQWAADEGIITGYGNGYFGVGDTITRADFVTILWRYYEPDAYATYNEATAKNTNGLPDVEDGKYYTEAVNWAVSNGIVTGYANGTFGPYDNITREQMVTIYYRFLNSRGADVTANSATLNTFPDAAGVSDYAYDAVCWATTHGVITGAQHNGISYVDATSAALREQACKIADIATAHDTVDIWHESSEEVYVPNYVTYYRCTCGEKFLTRSEAVSHEQSIATKSGYSSGEALREALTIHAGCDEIEIDEGSDQTIETGHTCNICGRGMTTNNSCYHDYQAVHEDVYVQSYTHVYYCNGCELTAAYPGLLTVHKKEQIEGIIPFHDTFSHNTQFDNSYYTNVITHYACSKCGDTFDVSVPQYESYGIL